MMSTFSLAQWREYDQIVKQIGEAENRGESKILRVGVECRELLETVGYTVQEIQNGVVAISWKNKHVDDSRNV